MGPFDVENDFNCAGSMLLPRGRPGQAEGFAVTCLPVDEILGERSMSQVIRTFLADYRLGEVFGEWHLLYRGSWCPSSPSLCYTILDEHYLPSNTQFQKRCRREGKEETNASNSKSGSIYEALYSYLRFETDAAP
ncbi:hypothetical protein CSIM01_02397 [Colletotrichum simmondsii]|uniref:Uncharacterized protein n=1 Tax=Colletotrichum simmondsii TaxID=703756 RepID=A0A135S7E6_9PEZI|nr:hypothetical protein CSIM01_02397 [Colletotrichum simmondsii]